VRLKLGGLDRVASKGAGPYKKKKKNRFFVEGSTYKATVGRIDHKKTICEGTSNTPSLKKGGGAVWSKTGE